MKGITKHLSNKETSKTLCFQYDLKAALVSEFVYVFVLRMDLIAQYSQLSEAAARRELRAMWKVQRIKLDELRVNFLEQDQLNFQV